MTYEQKIEAYHILLAACLDVIEGNKGIVVDRNTEWIVDMEKISLKFSTHLLSIADLMEFTKPSISYLDTQVNYMDFHSINVLSRAAQEAYLTMFYMYFDNRKLYEKKLRWKLWELTYLVNRQKINAPTELIRQTQKAERKQINKIIRQIKISKFLSANISPKEHTKVISKKIKYFDWKPKGGWKTIALAANFNEYLYDDIYSHLSASVHTDLTTLHELESIHGRENQINMISVALTSCFVSMALFLKQYYDRYDEIKRIIDRNRTAKDLMLIYSAMSVEGYPS